jgi:hypothetical protein
MIIILLFLSDFLRIFILVNQASIENLSFILLYLYYHFIQHKGQILYISLFIFKIFLFLKPYFNLIINIYIYMFYLEI